MEERPGPVHLELPEDVAAATTEGAYLVPLHALERPVAPEAALARAAAMILAAERPLIMIGAAGNRPRLVEALSAFVRRVDLPFFNTQMGKGAVNGKSRLYLGTAALSERDYVHQAIDRADLIISIGHDTVEKPPFLMKARGGPKVIHIGYLSADVEEVYPSRCRGDRRHRRHHHGARRSARRQARPPSGAAGAAAEGILDRHGRARRRRALPPHAAAHRA